jgi:hypothetical protein
VRKRCRRQTLNAWRGDSGEWLIAREELDRV